MQTLNRIVPNFYFISFECPLILFLFQPSPWFSVCSPTDSFKTFSSGICRDGRISQFSDIEQDMHDYLKMGL